MFGFRKNKNDDMFDTSAPDWFYEEGYSGGGDSSMRLENENRQTTKSYTANTTDAGGWANGFADNGARPAPPTEAAPGINRSVYRYNGKTFSTPMQNSTATQNAEPGGATQENAKKANAALGFSIFSLLMAYAQPLSLIFAVMAIVLAQRVLKTEKNNSKAKAAKIVGILMLSLLAAVIICTALYRIL